MGKQQSGKKVLITVYTILAILVLLVGGGFIYVFSIIHSPLPQTEGSLKVAGLKDSVEVTRDSNGIPHIYAKNMHDLLFAQGYVEAQDRWWQMEFNRRLCGGRVEELVGKKAGLVPVDIYFRTLGFYKVAQQEYDSSSPDERLGLDSFVDGVNAYILNRKPQDLSVNYTILGLTGVKSKIEPWSPLDSLTFGKLMSWDLGLNRDLETVRTKLYASLGREMTDQFLIPQPWPLNYHPTIIESDDVQKLENAAQKATLPAQQSNAGTVVNNVAASGQVYDNFVPDTKSISGDPEGIGSNGWVATGKMTKSGKSLLANDPHMGLPMPSLWYEVDLHCPDDGTGRSFDVAGFALEGSPGVVIGHNNDIAWGSTNVYPDVNDTYQIKVNPDNPLQYEWNGKWRDMTSHQETISFGDGKPPYTFTVRETHLGPITNENKYDAGADAKGGSVSGFIGSAPKSGGSSGFNNTDPLAQRWVAFEPAHLFRAVIGVNRASNWDEFRDALQYWETPAQSFLFADKQGNIGYQMRGKVPIRPKNLTGQVPTPGWSDVYEWKGYIPNDLLPRAYNPTRAYIVAANEEVAPPEYYEFLASQLGPDVNGNFGDKYNRWTYGYRAQRISELIKELVPNTPETFSKIQGDVKYLSADEILPYIANLKFSSQEVTDARDWLLKWDRRLDENSTQASLYVEFWLKMNKNTFQNKLGDLIRADGYDKEMWLANLILKNPNDPWWDDPSTKDKIETRDDILVRSFEEGYAATVEALGKDRSQWQWGKLHTLTFVSNPMGASGIGVIESLVNGGPIPVSGGDECVNNNVWAGGGSFKSTTGPALRMIVDFTDLTKSIGVNSTGQSGHPGSQWYGDMIDPWHKIKYHPMLWTRQQVDSDDAHKLMLTP